MTSQSTASKLARGLALNDMPPRDLAAYHFEHVRNVIFAAVLGLWRTRQSQGVKQVDLAKSLKRDPAWVSRSLRGPGNWTLRTFGELVAAMNGDIEVIVRPAEDVAADRTNYDAYKELEANARETRLPRLGSVKDALAKPSSETQRILSGDERSKLTWGRKTTFPRRLLDEKGPEWKSSLSKTAA